MERVLTPDIIIMAPPGEPHVEAMCEYFQAKHPSVKIFVFDTSSLPQKISCRISLETRSMKVELPGEENSVVSFEKLKSIWWWRPLPPAIDPKIRDMQQMRYAYRVCCQMLEGMWYLLDCLWVNQPERQEVALNLLYQYEVARMVGFRIPDSLVTNDPRAVLEFVQKHEEKVVYRQIIPLSSKVFAWSNDQIARLETLSLAPIMFQEVIHMEARVEAIAVGDAVLAFREQESKDPQKKYLLPHEIKLKIQNINKHTGLLYSRLRFGIDKDSNYVFLGMDPTAQFLEIEKSRQIPITELMGEMLLHGRMYENLRFWPTLPKQKK